SSNQQASGNDDDDDYDDDDEKVSDFPCVNAQIQKCIDGGKIWNQYTDTCSTITDDGVACDLQGIKTKLGDDGNNLPFQDGDMINCAATDNGETVIVTYCKND